MLLDIDIGKIVFELAIYLFLAFFIGLSQVGVCRVRLRVSVGVRF